MDAKLLLSRGRQQRTSYLVITLTSHPLHTLLNLFLIVVTLIFLNSFLVSYIPSWFSFLGLILVSIPYSLFYWRFLYFLALSRLWRVILDVVLMGIVGFLYLWELEFYRNIWVVWLLFLLLSKVFERNLKRFGFSQPSLFQFLKKEYLETKGYTKG